MYGVPRSVRGNRNRLTQTFTTMIKEEYLPYVDSLIELAVREDIGDGDHTSLASIPASERGRMRLCANRRA